VRFDRIDAREIDLSHLRKQIGVVLQENFVRGTAEHRVDQPDASFEETSRPPRSPARTRIERMPQGYDTFLEENASNPAAVRSSAFRLRARCYPSRAF
jgi:ATP-binding cassette subfamily B protein